MEFNEGNTLPLLTTCPVGDGTLTMGGRAPDGLTVEGGFFGEFIVDHSVFFVQGSCNKGHIHLVDFPFFKEELELVLHGAIFSHKEHARGPFVKAVDQKFSLSGESRRFVENDEIGVFMEEDHRLSGGHGKGMEREGIPFLQGCGCKPFDHTIHATGPLRKHPFYCSTRQVHPLS